MAASNLDRITPADPGLPAEALPAGGMMPGAAYRTMAQLSTLTTASQEKTVVIRLRGELDVTMCTSLEKLLAPLPGTRPDRLVIDLAEVSFMDCAAAATVFRAVRHTLPPGERPVMRAPRPPILRLLKILDLDRCCVLDISQASGAAADPAESPGRGKGTGRASMDTRLRHRYDLYKRAQAARDRSRLLAAEQRAVHDKCAATLQRIDAARDRAKHVSELWLRSRPATDRLRYSALARMQARLTSMPVIEQAKGIIMAQCGWPEDEAFDALRRASQRENTKLRDLAAKVVAQTTRSPQPRSGPPSAAKAADRKATRRTAPVALAAPPLMGRKSAG